LPPVRGGKKYQVTPFGLFGKAKGDIMSGYTVPGGFKIINQASQASRVVPLPPKGSTTRSFGSVK
jgi:hypothetical protein